GLGRIEFDVGEHGAPPIFLGKADVRDCFHRMLFGNTLSEYFCFLGGLAKEFGIVGEEIRDVVALADDCVWPCALALPMGWMDLASLAVRDISLESEAAEALGVSLDGVTRQTLVSRRRYWKVRLGLRWALALRRLAGRELEVLLGRCTFVGLMCRETLSVWHAVYTSVRERYWTESDVWQSARDELRCFLGLMPLLLRSEWGRPWLSQVFSVDASPRGRGIALSGLGQTDAENCG
ncbi:unnamed protein product, partial [Prorocentrum cordatum]